MKSMRRFLYSLMLVFLAGFLGVQDVFPVSADEPLDQTITVTIDAPENAVQGESFTVAATASSGLTVTYSADLDCTNVGATFTITSSSGVCMVQYDQAGDSTYNPAIQITQFVNVQAATATPTASTTPTESPSPTGTMTGTMTGTITETPTVTASPTRTRTPTRTATITRTVTLTRTVTSTKTVTPTRTITSTITRTPTITPTLGPRSLYVSAVKGDDSNPCDQIAQPCKTINGALGKANNGDTIQVTSGYYSTQAGAYVVTILKNVSLIGGWNETFSAHSGQSIVDAGNTRGGIYANATVSLSQFVVKRSLYYGIYNDGIIEMNRVGIIYSANGLYNDGTASLLNSTISSNVSNDVAGSAINNFGGTVTIQYSTITNNKGSQAVWSVNESAYIKISSSLLAKNPGGDCHANKSNITSYGHNIFGASPPCDGGGSNPFVPGDTDSIKLDPKIGPLTPFGYHFLLSGSSAIDQSSTTCPIAATDQRGVSRPRGVRCDVGAYESKTGGVAATFFYAKGSQQSKPVGSTYGVPFAVYVLDGVGSPVKNATVTFTAPASGAGGTFTDNNTRQTSAKTDVNGLARAISFTANNTVGKYQVIATITGISGQVVFELENLPIPTILSPSGTSVNTKPTYQWVKVNGASQYRYQLWGGSKLIFTNTTGAGICNTKTCSITPSVDLLNGNYKWRVQAMVNQTWKIYSAFKNFNILLIPKAGYWGGTFNDLYVTPERNVVTNFAIYINVNNCGQYKITRTVPVAIVNNYFSFNDSFYANGRFDSTVNGYGTVGMNHYYIAGCGYIVGGPYSWTAGWENETQPSMMLDAQRIPVWLEPQLPAVSEAGAYLVERIGP